VQFLFHRLRFHFRAEGAIHFAPGKSGNILRGAFGSVFHQLARERGETPVYRRIFEPVAEGPGPSGLADHPRPFVFRASHLDGRVIAAGSPFHFDVHLFDVAHHDTIAYFILTFAQLGREGLGPGRSKAALLTVEHLDLQGAPAGRIFENGAILPPVPIAELSIRLDAPPEPLHHLRVQFLTPTELKSGTQLAERPEFGILLARIRDRVSTLRALYGAGPLEMDFAAFGRRAAAVTMTRCDLTHISVSRLSSRTGQRHSLGGFTGTAWYEGELSEFLPFLIAGQYTGVGRQTTWGKGEIAAVAQKA